MAIVKGSKQYRSVVVRYSPWQRSVLILLIVALLLGVAALSAWFSKAQFAALEQQLRADNKHLSSELLKLSQQRDDAEQQLANLRMGSNLNQVVVNDVRAELNRYQNKIAKLTEEIAFYKGLMSPSERERGLSVRGLEFFSTSVKQVFQYKLVLQQTALKHQLLKGSVRVALIGSALDSEGEAVERRYALADLSEDIKVADIPLRFTYFQNIEGELTLPDDFKVQKVELVARAATPKQVQIEQTYEWNVQE